MLPSYDGGDQGFLNSYFEQIRYAPMFDQNETYQWKVVGSKERILRLSAAYNYDVRFRIINIALDWDVLFEFPHVGRAENHSLYARPDQAMGVVVVPCF